MLEGVSSVSSRPPQKIIARKLSITLKCIAYFFLKKSEVALD